MQDKEEFLEKIEEIGIDVGTNEVMYYRKMEGNELKRLYIKFGNDTILGSRFFQGYDFKTP